MIYQFDKNNFKVLLAQVNIVVLLTYFILTSLNALLFVYSQNVCMSETGIILFVHSKMYLPFRRYPSAPFWKKIKK